MYAEVESTDICWVRWTRRGRIYENEGLEQFQRCDDGPVDQLTLVESAGDCRVQGHQSSGGGADIPKTLKPCWGGFIWRRDRRCLRGIAKLSWRWATEIWGGRLWRQSSFPGLGIYHCGWLPSAMYTYFSFGKEEVEACSHKLLQRQGTEPFSMYHGVAVWACSSARVDSVDPSIELTPEVDLFRRSPGVLESLTSPASAQRAE